MVFSINDKKLIWETIDRLDNSISDALSNLLLDKLTNSDVSTIYRSEDKEMVKIIDSIISNKIEELCF